MLRCLCKPTLADRVVVTLVVVLASTSCLPPAMFWWPPCMMLVIRLDLVGQARATLSARRQNDEAAACCSSARSTSAFTRQRSGLWLGWLYRIRGAKHQRDLCCL